MRDLYFSFFMFTADLRPDDRVYTQTIVAHMRALVAMGYAGFDLPIAPTDASTHDAALESYKGLKHALDAAGLDKVGITTNVAATRAFDPSSEDTTVRAAALAYLTSRVDITAALGGRIMAGPIVFPYGAYPKTAWGDPIWSDALQAWAARRCRHARPVIEALGEYAEKKGVKVAIEPVDHWETAPANLVSDVMCFLAPIRSRVGLCVDSAHVALGSDGPAAYAAQMAELAVARRLHYIHVSAPDRGAVADSWIDWARFLPPVLAHYDGPILVEVFNAIPPFLDGLRLTRRRFWRPGEDAPRQNAPSAYAIARDAIAAMRGEIARLAPASACP